MAIAPKATQPSMCEAHEADLDTLLEIMREFYDYDGHDFVPDRARAALLGLLRDPLLGKTVLISDGKVAAGYIVLTYGYSLEYHGRDAFIDEFFLRPPYRGKGWGTRVLSEIENIARQAGCRALHLEVSRRNPGARRFYERADFRVHDGELMTKRLAGEEWGVG